MYVALESLVASGVTFSFHHLWNNFLQMHDVPPALGFVHRVPEAKYAFNKLILCSWFHLSTDELLQL